MDCFKVKLVLRKNHHCAPRDLSLDVFDHLFLCRSCWAYANYLWHREALESRLADDDEAQEERLEKAWNHRHDRPLPLPPQARSPTAGRWGWPEVGKLRS